MSTYNNTAIVFGGLKDALLYYEYVIPMNVSGEFTGLRPQSNISGSAVRNFRDINMQGFRDAAHAFPSPEAVSKLYPPHLARHSLFKDYVNMFDGALFSFMVREFLGDDKFREYVATLANVVGTEQPDNPFILSPSMKGVQMMFSQLVADFELHSIPVDGSNFVLENAENNPPVNSVEISRIPVIDTTKATFEQIMEFRKDEGVMQKMRNFRLFAYDEYTGKTPQYVEDDIQKRLSQYEDVIAASGFETVTKTLSFLFESKSLAGAFATSAFSILMGNTQLAAGAFSAGVVLEIGKLSLQFAAQKHELTKICRDNPVSFISEAKRRLEK